MKTKQEIKALIFDFDGLIVDTETTDFAAWQQIFASYGAVFPRDVWDQIIGTHCPFDPLDLLAAQIGYALEKTAVTAQRRQIEAELLAAQPILPGVLDTLNQARELDLKIGLASSSKHEWVDPHLARLELADWFEVVCCSDDVDGRTKPDPAVYQTAVAGLGVLPNNALALEDSPNGALAARRAGLTCVVIPNVMTAHLDFTTAAPHMRLNALSDLSLTQLLAALSVQEAVA
ncbi:MAG: HAD-IA family hydrolase [Anaerolineales bacterium]|nr:HAD-IA family hydrolase [Anaerolineales bacterium]